MTEKRFIHANHGHMKDHRSGIIRSEMYFCRTTGVPLPEYEALLFGFQKIINETERNVTVRNFDNQSWGNGDYGSPDWYQNEALTSIDNGYGRQVSAFVLQKLLWEEPYQAENPHFDALIVDRDLIFCEGDGGNFIFGYGPYPFNIISVNRFINWIKDSVLRQISLSIIGAHEFGHNLDLVNRSFNIGTEGLKAGHCNGENGPCLMEQMNVEGCRNVDEQARLIYNREKWLCIDCTAEIETKRNDLIKRSVHW